MASPNKKPEKVDATRDEKLVVEIKKKKLPKPDALPYLIAILKELRELRIYPVPFISITLLSAAVACFFTLLFLRVYGVI